MFALSLVSRLTLVEAVIVHVSVHVQILPGHKGEFCLRVLVGSIVRVVTERRGFPLFYESSFFYI